LVLLQAPIPLTACSKPTVAVAPHEPYVTKGPTEVLVGLYIQGGALIPGCPQRPRGPSGGVVTLSRHGKVVATDAHANGGTLFVIRVAPGTYTLTARNEDNHGNGDGAQLGPVKVTVRKGQSVRRDLFLDVP
jgi:hypothetical protein